MPLDYGKQPVKAAVSDVTATRALDTIYQNTTGRPILALVSFNFTRDTNAGDLANVIIRVENATPPTVLVGQGGLPVENIDDSGEKMQQVLVLVVPNQYYYEIESFTIGALSAIAIASWIEIEL